MVRVTQCRAWPDILDRAREMFESALIAAGDPLEGDDIEFVLTYVVSHNWCPTNYYFAWVWLRRFLE